MWESIWWFLTHKHEWECDYSTMVGSELPRTEKWYWHYENCKHDDCESSRTELNHDTPSHSKWEY